MFHTLVAVLHFSLCSFRFSLTYGGNGPWDSGFAVCCGVGNAFAAGSEKMLSFPSIFKVLNVAVADSGGFQ